MQVVTREISLKTQGETDILDVTPHVTQVLEKEGLTRGLVTIFVPGSTASVTTIENEPGLVSDLKKSWEKLIPPQGSYAHNRGGEDNGHSHLRASLVGPSLTIPIVEGKLALGTWQQIVLLDFDTRPRHRKLLLQLMGE